MPADVVNFIFMLRKLRRIVFGGIAAIAVFAVNAYAQGPAITISEIHYNSDSTRNSGDWFELYNTTSNPIDISSYRLRDSSATGLYLVPSGVTIPANGYLVFCSDTARFDAIYNITNRIGDLGFGLNNNADGIRIFDNTNTLLLEVFYQDSLPWPMGADGYGRTLELSATTSDPTLPASWRTGCVLGSPGAAFSPCVLETLVVSEINYKSSVTEDAGDWIELRNIGSSAVDISGFKLRDDKNTNVYQIPSGTVLTPQGSVVIYDTPAKFNLQFPFVTNKVGPMLFSLGGDGGAIRLYNSLDKVVFSVYYDDDPPWSDQPDGNGYTLEADTNFNLSRDVNNASSWFAGCPEGSPGVKYNPNCLGGVEDEFAATLQVYPNPVSDMVRISADGLPETFIVTLTDMQGRNLASWNTMTSLPVGGFAPGVYFLRMESNGVRYMMHKILITGQ